MNAKAIAQRQGEWFWLGTESSPAVPGAIAGMDRIWRRLQGPLLLGSLLLMVTCLTSLGLCQDRADALESPPTWDVLASQADSLRREVRLARMQLCPRKIRLSELAYANMLALASARVTATDTIAPDERGALRRLLGHLIAGRDPATFAWLERHWPHVGHDLDPAGTIRFWVGLHAYDTDQWQAAASCFAGAVEPLLQGYADWLRVRAMDQIDRARGGAEALAVIRRSPRHRLRGLLMLRAGRHLLEHGKKGRLLQLMEPWLHTLDPGSSLSARGQTIVAEAHRRGGRRELFLQAFQAASRGGEIEEQERELRTAQAHEILGFPKLPRGDPLADCLVSLAQGGAIEVALRTWRERSAELRGADSLRVLQALLDSLYRERRNRTILELAAQLDSGASARCQQRAQLIAGRTLRRQGRLEEMVKAFRKAALWDGNTPITSRGARCDAIRALWELGRELEDQLDWARAAEAFSRLASHFPNDEMAPEAHLRALLCSYRAGEREAALHRLEEFCARAQSDQVGGPCLWRALLSEKSDPQAYLEAASREADPGYFALRSAYAINTFTRQGADESKALQHSQIWLALSAEIRNPQGWDWPQSEPVCTLEAAERILSSVEGNPSAEAGVLLLAFGYRAWARSLWATLPGHHARDAAEMATLYRGLGDFGRSILQGLRTQNPRERYPVGFSAEIAQASARFRLSPGFILAVMRQESLLEPAVRSRAGAIGLMQLMPRTARRLEDSLALGAMDLERPLDNILLGAAHLAELLEKTDGSVPMSLAAYNAGLDHAERWLSNWKSSDPGYTDWDSYVNGISFAETRKFVKSVLAHYWSYLACYPNGVSVHQGAQGVGSTLDAEGSGSQAP
ncbi:MAG: transglycosylase SLT domain-containing protein [Candidatus Eisenbacteria sp.]|nr:transglycosylase SLT domain-containing protein [Candidatus Eisenbacteria bacterium]